MNTNLRIVVLPGWGHDASHWARFVELSEGKAEVIEFPGFGKEPLVSEEWGVREYKDWLSKKLTGSAPQSISLVGHSFGARVAALLGSEQPVWLASLVLYGAPLLYRPSITVRLQIMCAKFLKPFVPQSMRKMARTKDLQEADASSMGGIYRRAASYDQSSTLSLISARTLLLYGAEDKDAPVEQGKEACKLIPHARMEVVGRAGHNVHLEKPELFYGLVSRFIEGR